MATSPAGGATLHSVVNYTRGNGTEHQPPRTVHVARADHHSNAPSAAAAQIALAGWREAAIVWPSPRELTGRAGGSFPAPWSAAAWAGVFFNLRATC